MFPTYQVIFYFFAALLVAASTMVIFSRNPVRAVLFLVLAFFTSSVLWMLIQAEFLALVLIFVYVGAVMTLFLFVVMMLNIDLSKQQEKFVRFLPFALLVMVVFVGTLVAAYVPHHLPDLAATALVPTEANVSNTEQLGELLFTNYLYEFEIAGAILLVAIVASISLAFTGRKPNTKVQDIEKQHAATKQSRLRIIKMQAENK